MPLLAVILQRSSKLFLSPNDDRGATPISQTVQLASRWAGVHCWCLCS
ncbi:MAG: hypothetical protein VKO39_01425 [Cyanobacteriota bacterium]|nr:hypothetical protein [Cyanobacteriota bacterium]